MRNMFASAIAKACGGTLVNEENLRDVEIKGAVIDSRLVEEDYLFFATKGERVDGHDFIKGAFEKGAALCICEHEVEGVIGPCIIVKDSFQALKDVATFYRSGLDVIVVGITGSVGKTSTKEFIASVLSEKYCVLKTEKNYNNEVGLPLTILKIREEHRIAVLEMGISDFKEMSRLTRIAKPDYCVITNIGTCHLEKLIDRQGVLAAKTEIFEAMNPNGAAVLFGDDDLLSTVSDVHGNPPVFYGMKDTNQIHIKKYINRGIWGSECTITTGLKEFDVSVSLPGEHMIYNALAATAVGNLLGLSVEQIKAGIEKVKPVEGRSNLISKNGIVVIDDCYNANPVSMKSALDLLCQAVTPKVAILGDMFELGENEVDFHREIGTYAMEIGINTLICIGQLSRNMAEAANACVLLHPGTDVFYFKNKEEFFEKYTDLIKKDDTVLVKASHGMGFSEIVDVLTGPQTEGKLKPSVAKLFGGKEGFDEETPIQDFRPLDAKDNGYKSAASGMNKKNASGKKHFTLSAQTKKNLIIAGVILLICLLIGIAIGVIRVNAYNNKVQGVLLYQQNQTMLGTRLFPDVEYSDDPSSFVFSDMDTTGLSDIGKRSSSFDGKYIYFPKNVIGREYDLYYTKKNSSKSVLIEKSVTDYEIVSKGNILYAAGNGLYLYQTKEGSVQMICADAGTFTLNKKKTAVLFRNTDGKLSYVELKNPSSLRTLDTEVSQVCAYSDNLDKIYYYKNGSLYFIKGWDEPVPVADEVEDFLLSDMNEKAYLYYLSAYRVLYVYEPGMTRPMALLTDVERLITSKHAEEGFLAEDKAHKLYFIQGKDKSEIKNNEWEIQSTTLFADSGKLYMIGQKEGMTSLLSLQKGVISNVTGKVSFKVEENNAASLELIDGNRIYILKTGENGRKDLYCDGTLVARNVYPGSLSKTLDGENVVFLYEECDSFGNYKMGIADGKKVISSGNYSMDTNYSAVTQKKIYTLKKTDSGTALVRYNGHKEKVLEENVDDFRYVQ